MHPDPGSKKFEFDPASHIYKLDGFVLPGVTSVIGAVVPRNYTCDQHALDRGRVLHKAIHLLNQGFELDPEHIDDEIKGRLSAFRLFQKENDAKIVESEIHLASERYGYAGTPDAIMTLGNNWRCQSLVDFKSSLEAQVLPQIGAYQRLLRENGRDEPENGLALWLREDGTYRCRWFTPSELRIAEQTFLACLTVYNFMKENGMRT